MEMATALTELKRMQKASIVKEVNLLTKLDQQEQLLKQHKNEDDRRLTEYIIAYVDELISQNLYYREGIEKAIQLIELSNNSTV